MGRRPGISGYCAQGESLDRDHRGLLSPRGCGVARWLAHGRSIGRYSIDRLCIAPSDPTLYRPPPRRLLGMSRLILLFPCHVVLLCDFISRFSRFPCYFPTPPPVLSTSFSSCLSYPVLPRETCPVPLRHKQSRLFPFHSILTDPSPHHRS